MVGSSRRLSPPPILSARRQRSPPPRAQASSSSRRCSTPSPPRLAPPKCRRQPRRSASILDLPMPPTPVYRGVWQRSWGAWVVEITDRNTHKKVWVGSFQSAEQPALAYDVKNVDLHSADCGELNFPLGCGMVPDLEPTDLRLVSDRERLEAERRAARMVATLAGLNSELVEEERKLLEEFAEAKRKTDVVKKKGVADAAGPPIAPAPARVMEEDVSSSSAGQSTAPALIELDSDSSYDWDED